MGSDLLKSLITVCRDHDIFLGEVRGIGALAHTRLAYFDQTTRMYETLEFEYDMEISSFLSSISVQGNWPIKTENPLVANWCPVAKYTGWGM